MNRLSYKKLYLNLLERINANATAILDDMLMLQIGDIIGDVSGWYYNPRNGLQYKYIKVIKPKTKKLYQFAIVKKGKSEDYCEPA